MTDALKTIEDALTYAAYVIGPEEKLLADALAALRELQAQDFDTRGLCAEKLKCWHRLSEDEAAELVAFVQGLQPSAQPVWQALTQKEVVDAFCNTPHSVQYVSVFDAGVRFAEKHHGISAAQPAQPAQQAQKSVAYDESQVEQFLMGLTGPNDAQRVCIEMYQVVGSLLEAVGMFETDKGAKILDNLADMKKVHDDVLPFEVKPRQWVELTEADVDTIAGKIWGCQSIAPRHAKTFYEAISAALREKNGGAA